MYKIILAPEQHTLFKMVKQTRKTPKRLSPEDMMALAEHEKRGKKHSDRCLEQFQALLSFLYFLLMKAHKEYPFTASSDTYMPYEDTAFPIFNDHLRMRYFTLTAARSSAIKYFREQFLKLSNPTELSHLLRNEVYPSWRYSVHWHGKPSSSS